ncbi:hypothetical protein Pcinc_037845 [Petrolisthes cinctipes]|uniref:Uncharacterized protein n=1 Tax=Petrolisthes cinctipes TaxID=88211 RepID=A0AAE1BVP2_PETCI|nr:hypothetical protein Pcinc_037845 [Petrolisthes cinctipes]
MHHHNYSPSLPPNTSLQPVTVTANHPTTTTHHQHNTSLQPVTAITTYQLKHPPPLPLTASTTHSATSIHRHNTHHHNQSLQLPHISINNHHLYHSLPLLHAHCYRHKPT